METTASLITVEEAAQYLHVSKITIYRMLYAKKIEAIKVGKLWRIDPQKLAGGKK